MTFLEQKLLDLFRACPDEKKFGVLEIARILSDLPDSDCDPVSLTYSVQTSTPDPDTVRAGQRMEQIAQKAEIPVRYQMVSLELCYLHDLTIRDGNEFNALCLAFDYGFVKGNRATRRGKVKAL